MPTASDGLNRAQRAAVTHPGGPLVIVAGAGTGKTRTLTRRFAWLVEQGVAADEVLALTFSSAAAAEMRERLEALIEVPYEELHVGTFHSFCSRLLADEALEAGLDPFFTPVTPADRLALLLDRQEELRLRHHEIRGNPAPLLASFVSRIDRLKDEMVGAERFHEYAERMVDRCAGEDDAARAHAARELEFAGVYADHDRLLAEQGALDFGELIARAYSLLHEHPHVRRRVAERFRHVLVDEYQDTNFAQGMLLGLLATEHHDITVVGDDDQAIYRFRGASRKNLEAFVEEFPEAETVSLERNYRSGQRILDAARAVVEPTERLDKRLKGRQGGEVRFWRCQSERAQAQAVAAEAERLVTGDGVAPDRVAVLVRSVRHEGATVGAALEERALPFRLSGSAAYFQRAEVRDVLAWLRLLADATDSGAVVRALSRPPIELRSVDVARLTQHARRRKLDMPSAVAAGLEGPQLSPEG
ncbi:MAG: ATP-dependent helicase, partial [Actinomycetota bacterium]|nr:ATP-dependent helicase [Actinomycetota bacterium]